MTYRDDQDAALARIDALEHDVAVLTEERDALRGERDALREERDRLRGERDDLVRRAAPPRLGREPWRSYAMLGGAIAVVGILVVMVVTCRGGDGDGPGSSRTVATAGPDAAPAPTWSEVDGALLDLRNCTGVFSAWVRYRAAMGAEEIDPRKRKPGPSLGEQLSHLTDPRAFCEPHARAITGATALPASLRDSVAAWFAAAQAVAAIAGPLSQYYSQGDYADDDAAFARAEWPKLHAAMRALEERRRAIDVGALEAALDAHSADPMRDLLRAIDRAAWAGLGEQVDAAALRATIGELIAAQAAAPVEVRRASRDLPAALERAAAAKEPVEIGTALLDARFTVQARSWP